MLLLLLLMLWLAAGCLSPQGIVWLGVLPVTPNLPTSESVVGSQVGSAQTAVSQGVSAITPNLPTKNAHVRMCAGARARGCPWIG